MLSGYDLSKKVIKPLRLMSEARHEFEIYVCNDAEYVTESMISLLRLYGKCGHKHKLTAVN